MPPETFLSATNDPQQPNTAHRIYVPGTFSRSNLNSLGLVEGTDYVKNDITRGVASFTIQSGALQQKLGIEFHPNAPERS